MRSDSICRSAERLIQFEEEYLKQDEHGRRLALFGMKREAQILLRRAFKLWVNLRLKGGAWLK